MIDKLIKHNVSTSDVELLKNYNSREGFKILDGEESNDMEDHFSEYPIFENIIAVLTDENSNYWCLYIKGPMKGMVCYLNHDETNLEPKFISLSSFLNTIENNPELEDFYDIHPDLFDFPTSIQREDFKERKNIIEELQKDFDVENDEEVKQQMAFAIMALCTTNEIEESIYPFLNDEDMYIQERAIQMIGFHNYKPAKEKLTELRETAMHNGKQAIDLSLIHISEPTRPY